MTTRVKYQIEVYDVTASSGYKSGSNAVTREDEEAVTDGDCLTYFVNNKYPDPLPATNGTDKLTAEDQSAVFNRKTYADVDAAKTAIISDSFATIISNNCSTINYTLDSNNLILDCYFENTTKQGNLLTALCAVNDTQTTWSKEPGAVWSTID